MDFSGRGVIVTGAASGIGLATAKRLMSEGARVAGLDTGTPPEELTRLDSYLSLEADVTDEAAVEQAIGAARSEFGRIDGVVTAAGIASGGAAHMVSLAD